MAEKNIKTRIQNKHDKKENWDLATFAPLPGEIIIYDSENASIPPLVKVGNGTTPIGDLPFITDVVQEELDSVKEQLSDLQSGSLISSGTFDPDATTTSQFYFKYSAE